MFLNIILLHKRLELILNYNDLDSTIMKVLGIYIKEIQEEFEKTYNSKIDIFSYTGNIEEMVVGKFREFVEEIKNKKSKSKTLVMILYTPGGSAIAVEQMVNIMRYNYKEIYFIVPESAMSAGTILCMSGDKIFMDYSSSLGPIDPQVRNDDNKWVAALGYIDKIEELIKKSKDGIMSDAEFAMLQKIDLGTIRAYEQARDLSINLLEVWLAKYKFKDWHEHRTHSVGNKVTMAEKNERTKEIAEMLSDNKKWHTHGRHINIEMLKGLKLEIEDYSKKYELRNKILKYHKLLMEYVQKIDRRIFLHTDFKESK